MKEKIQKDKHVCIKYIESVVTSTYFKGASRLRSLKKTQSTLPTLFVRDGIYNSMADYNLTWRMLSVCLGKLCYWVTFEHFELEGWNFLWCRSKTNYSGAGFLVVSHDSIRGCVRPLVGPSVRWLVRNAFVLAGRDEPANNLFHIYELVFSSILRDLGAS